MKLKVLHLPASSLPWITGGKEVYCQTLARALQEQDSENVVAIHQNQALEVTPGVYEWEGIPIHVLPPLPDYSSRRVMYERTFPELPGFHELLEKIRPDIVHFHDQSGGASLSHLRAVRQRRMRALITYHSPGQTCPQRELLRYGHIPCDGEVRRQRCTACRLNVSGVPRPLAHLAALAEWPGFDPWSASPVARTMTARTTTRLFQNALHEFIELADAVVVLAEWSGDVWRRNGCPEEKLRFIRTGGTRARPEAKVRAPRESSVLRVACLGRCEWMKGLHVLVEAVKSLPADRAIEIHFLGPYWESAYGQDLARWMAGDSRFAAPRLVPPGELPAVLDEMDCVVVPSVWLETGPLTVFDAFGAGIPVLGSRLGGIAELVRDGVDGLLFTSGQARELAGHLDRLIENPGLLQTLTAGVRPPRTLQEASREYRKLYDEILARPAASPPGGNPGPEMEVTSRSPRSSC